jgi:hypothetical protein
VNRNTTERGFAIYDEFTDTYGSRIRVQESSSAEESRCWIFAEDSNGVRGDAGPGCPGRLHQRERDQPVIKRAPDRPAAAAAGA